MEKLPGNSENAENQSERPVSIDRIVGLNKTEFESKGIDEDNVRQRFIDGKEARNSGESLAVNEIKKTPEQTEIESFVLDQLPEFLKAWGLEQPLSLKESDIKIYDLSHLEPEEREEARKSAAQWNAHRQLIQLNGDNVSSNLKFMHDLVHECVHAHGYHSIKATGLDEDGSIRTESRRTGIETADTELHADNFSALNEGLTELIARSFVQSNFEKLPSLQEDIADIKSELREYYESLPEERKRDTCVKDPLTGLRVGTGRAKTVMIGRPYEDQVSQLLSTAERLSEQNPETIRSKKHALHSISSVYFTGKGYITLMKMVQKLDPEKTLHEAGLEQALRHNSK